MFEFVYVLNKDSKTTTMNDVRAAWNIVKDHVLHDTWTLVSNIVLVTLVFVVVGIVLYIFLGKFGYFKRKPRRVYGIVVKLFVPVVLVFLGILGFQYGLVRGCYKVLLEETQLATEASYDYAMAQVFDEPEQVEAFLTSLRAAGQEMENSEAKVADFITEELLQMHDDATLVEEVEHSVAEYFLEKYQRQMYTAAAYGIYTGLGVYAQGWRSFEGMDFDDFNENADKLLNVDITFLQTSIKEQMNLRIERLYSHFYTGMQRSTLIFTLILLLLPIIEWLIFKKFFSPKLEEEMAIIPNSNAQKLT